MVNKLVVGILSIFILVGVLGFAYSYGTVYHPASEIDPGQFGNLRTADTDFSGLVGLGLYANAELPACTDDSAGQMVFSTTEDEPVICDGSEWMGVISDVKLSSIDNSCSDCSGICEDYDCSMEVISYDPWEYMSHIICRDNCGVIVDDNVEDCDAISGDFVVCSTTEVTNDLNPDVCGIQPPYCGEVLCYNYVEPHCREYYDSCPGISVGGVDGGGVSSII